MTQPRRVAVFTGSRAEYGLQYPILRAIAADPRLEYRLIVGGTHLQEDFGSTEAEITDDGFRVDAKVETIMRRDTLAATAEAIGTGILSWQGCSLRCARLPACLWRPLREPRRHDRRDTDEHPHCARRGWRLHRGWRLG